MRVCSIYILCPVGTYKSVFIYFFCFKLISDIRTTNKQTFQKAYLFSQILKNSIINTCKFFWWVVTSFCFSISVSRSNDRRCSIIQGLLKNFAKLTGKYLCGSCNQQLYYKRDSDTGVFQRILRNFSEHIFHRPAPDDCLCVSQRLHFW